MDLVIRELAAQHISDFPSEAHGPAMAKETIDQNAPDEGKWNS